MTTLSKMLHKLLGFPRIDVTYNQIKPSPFDLRDSDLEKLGRNSQSLGATSGENAITSVTSEEIMGKLREEFKCLFDGVTPREVEKFFYKMPVKTPYSINSNGTVLQRHTRHPFSCQVFLPRNDQVVELFAQSATAEEQKADKGRLWTVRCSIHAKTLDTLVSKQSILLAQVQEANTTPLKGR